jgi:hypothetical protein
MVIRTARELLFNVTGYNRVMANGSRSVWEQMIMASFTLALVVRFGNVEGSVFGLRFCYKVMPYVW